MNATKLGKDYLYQANLGYKGKDGLTSTMCKKLTKIARCAIKMRSVVPNRKHAAELLHVDLHTVFGVHTKHCLWSTHQLQ